jgi:hypothetical protein
MDVDYQMLHHAVEFKKVMLMTKHDLEGGIDRRMEGIRAVPVAPPPVAEPAVPPPAPAAPAVPAGPTTEEKLRSLAKMRDDGLITAEDYEVKKGDLLDRL